MVEKQKHCSIFSYFKDVCSHWKPDKWTDYDCVNYYFFKITIFDGRSNSAGEKDTVSVSVIDIGRPFDQTPDLFDLTI